MTYLTDGHGQPIRPVDEPPTEPAGQPSYGPSPTAQGVRGYRDLPADDVDTINAIKALQEQIARVWASVRLRPGVDVRWCVRARDHIEDGISAMVRAIAQPHDPFGAALSELSASMRQSTQEQNSAQPSQDQRPDSPETIGDSIRRHGWGGRPQ